MRIMTNRTWLIRHLLTGGAVVATLSAQAAVAQAVPATPPPAEAAAPRSVKALAGDLNPFKGDIDPFKGDLNPFKGDLNPFWGNIDPFYGAIDPFGGDLNPFWGSINPVTRIIDPLAQTPAWNSIGAYWKGAGKDWGEISRLSSGPNAGNGPLSKNFGDFLAKADATWGAAITAKTGQSFAEGFANPLLAKHGVNAADPASLTQLTEGQRNRLFLDWYDGLMAFSGADRVDHWMSAVNWTPAITQQQGSGVDTIIGLLDADARSDLDIANNIIWSGGYTAKVGGHGAGVASLMVAAHDGRGVMGIAPRARVVAYNPFDATYSASWDDVRTGVSSLRAKGASIINASLGMPGWTLPQEWQGVFAGVNSSEAATPLSLSWGSRTYQPSKPIYVIAAGNSGTTQTQDINWDFSTNSAFLVVGSVDPSGAISNFSNRPGTACLLRAGSCSEADRLMNRFIVAPGELILVSDGGTGVIRRSGTSFAAPIVSGAIALLHDRWPWLVRHPQETSQIILDTATDLGAPGVDPVYGAGLLDIAASQSPIDFGSLNIFEVKNGIKTQVSAPQLLAGGVQSTWEADGVYFTLYEPLGATYRDFQVPMSSRLTGWVRSWSGRPELFQRFITGRFTDWINGNNGFTDTASYGVAAANGLRVNIAGSAPVTIAGRRHLTSHSALSVETAGGRFAFTTGQGFGALVNGAQPGFARSTDYDAAGGGANPLLGLASGGAFLQGAAKLGRGTVSLGMTENRIAHRNSALFSASERYALRGLDEYRAQAVNVHLTQPLGNRVTMSLDYARVVEANALLGVQSTLASDLGGGATTDAYSFGARVDMGRGFALSMTGTQGQTRSDRDQMLTTKGAIASSAYSLSLQQHGVADGGDLLAVTLSQPLHVHGGELQLNEVRVVDRLTGDLGNTSQAFGIGGDRRQIVGEVQYAVPIAQGAGRVGLYGKGDLQVADGQAPAFVAGVHISLKF